MPHRSCGTSRRSSSFWKEICPAQSLLRLPLFKSLTNSRWARSGDLHRLLNNTVCLEQSQGGSAGDGARAVSGVLEGHLRQCHPRLRVMPAAKMPSLSAHVDTKSVPPGVSNLVRAAIHVAETQGLARVGILTNDSGTVSLVGGVR
jgi:hypothetical protein